MQTHRREKRVVNLEGLPDEKSDWLEHESDVELLQVVLAVVVHFSRVFSFDDCCSSFDAFNLKWDRNDC
jgi:hypothetical protein